MAKKLSGLTANTAKNLVLDAGAFYKDFLPASDTPATASAKLIGATQGGGSFSAVPAVRQIQVDGSPGAIRGLEVIDGWDVKLTTNLLEASLGALKLALGGVKEETPAQPAGYKKLTGNMDFADADYATNITWVGTLSGSAKPVIIVVKNALSVNGLNLTFKDKGEALVPVTLSGHYVVTALDDSPFEIYMPTV